MTLNLDINEINIILNALGQRPFLEVQALIPKIQQQAQAQVQVQQEQKNEPANTAPEV